MGWKIAEFRTAVQARIGSAASVDQEIIDAVNFLSRRIQLEVHELHATTVSSGLTSIDRPQNTSKVEMVYVPSENLEIYEISSREKRATQDRANKIYFWMSHPRIEFTADLSKFAPLGAQIYTRYLQTMTIPTATAEYNGPDVTLQVIVAIAAYFYMLRRVAEYIVSPVADITLSEMQSTARLFGEAMDEQLEGIDAFWKARRYAGRPEPLPSARSDE